MARVVGVENKLLYQVGCGVEQYVLKEKRKESYFYKHENEPVAACNFFISSKLYAIRRFSETAKNSQGYN